MKIFIEQTDETMDKKFSGKVKELLKQLNINSHTVLIVKNKELITEEDDVKNSDNLRILSVISGG